MTDTQKRSPWPNPDARKVVPLACGESIALREELTTEAYHTLKDLLQDEFDLHVRPAEPQEVPPDWQPTPAQPVCYVARRLTREDRRRQREITREFIGLWVDEWSLRAPGAPETALPVPVTAEALRELAPSVAEEIWGAVSAHQGPYLDAVLGIFKGAPAGNAAADPLTTGATTSSRSASARTRPRTSSRSGPSGGTRGRS